MKKIIFAILWAIYLAVSYYFVLFSTFIGLGWSRGIVLPAIIIYVAGAIIVFRKISGLTNWVFLCLILAPSFIAVAAFTIIQNNTAFNYYARAVCPGVNDAEDMPNYCIWPARQCWAIINENKKNLCFIDVAGLKKNASICDNKIKYIDTKNSCYAWVARAKGDTDLCNKISKDIIKDNCYKSIAADKYDLSICGLIQASEKKNECYADIAKLQKDPTICATISEKEAKDECYNVVNKN